VIQGTEARVGSRFGTYKTPLKRTCALRAIRDFDVSLADFDDHYGERGINGTQVVCCDLGFVFGMYFFVTMNELGTNLSMVIQDFVVVTDVVNFDKIHFVSLSQCSAVFFKRRTWS
jgi:hypothetical protein